MKDKSLKKVRKHKILKRILLIITLAVVSCILIFVAAGFIPAKDNVPGVRKSTYVTMKDGTKIAIWYTLPTDLKKGEKIPAIMQTTRYGTKYECTFVYNALQNLGIMEEPPPAVIKALAQSRYAIVDVDARGSGASFGKRDMEWSKEEIDDMGQVIDWITNQSWSDKKVGTYGMSYSGNTAELAASTNRTALLAAAPLYPDFSPVLQQAMPGGICNDLLIKKWSDANIASDSNNVKDTFIDGISPLDVDNGKQLLDAALKEHHNINIYDSLKKITYMDDVITEKYTSNSIAPYYYQDKIQKSGVPLYVRVGWQDAGTVNGAIERFLTYSNSQTLVIGPWSHAGGFYYDPLMINNYTRDELEKKQAEEVVRFFDYYLKNDNTQKDAKQIKYYTFGEGKWKTTNTWPVAGFETQKLYFDSNGSLSSTKPSSTSANDEYKIDFTASTGENNRWFTNIGGGSVFYPDRSQEDKKLLTYTSQAMENDIEITGVPVVTLNLSTTAEDGAFFTYLEDVAPDGKVTYITEGELRALHRKVSTENLGYTALGPVHSFLRKDGKLLKPGENTELKIGMYATSVLIKKGHKIRIAIAGHDAANFSRVPETGTPIIQVHRNSVLSSYVELPFKNR